MRFSRADPDSRYAKAIHEAASDAARRVIRSAVRRYDGDAAKASAWLGITVAQFRRSIDELGLGDDLDAARAAAPPLVRRGRRTVPRGDRGRVTP